MAAECDLVIVVGSPNSSNSVRLVEVAKDAGNQAHQNQYSNERGHRLPKLSHGTFACITERAMKKTPRITKKIPSQRMAFTGSPRSHLPRMAVPT